MKVWSVHTKMSKYFGIFSYLLTEIRGKSYISCIHFWQISMNQLWCKGFKSKMFSDIYPFACLYGGEQGLDAKKSRETDGN